MQQQMGNRIEDVDALLQILIVLHLAIEILRQIDAALTKIWDRASRIDCARVSRASLESAVAGIECKGARGP